jgi:hypothetical protein
MKYFLRMLLFAYLCCLSSPSAVLAFADSPVAVVILDRTGGFVDKNLSATWTEMVRRRFHFPDYKLIDRRDLLAALRGKLPPLGAKYPRYQAGDLKYIANAASADLLFVIVADKVDDAVIHSRWPFGETLLRVKVAIDLLAYRAADGKYLAKKIRHFKTDILAVSFSAEKIANEGVSDAIDDFREKLPASARGGTISG